MANFELTSDYRPTGDQPEAIAALTQGFRSGARCRTLEGVTGSGKTFTMANVIAELGRPTLVISHNKTLAAQLYGELKEFFPRNAVEYFVSYYDYYQPEAYIPQQDLYIEKDADINDEIERLRLAATAAVLTRRDTIIVASVSAIYALGSPEEWGKVILPLQTGQTIRRETVMRHLVSIFYDRNDIDFKRGTFRARGDVLEIRPAYTETAYRLSFWGDEIESITEIQPLTGEVLERPQEIRVFPARHYVTSEDKLQQALVDIEKELEAHLTHLRAKGKELEAQRLEQRTNYDLEMIREIGYCSGIENYSRHMDQRPTGTPPWTLIDYFPDDFLLVVDESHMTIPQVRGMYLGDRSRKLTLVDYGFRLPSALDNRPLFFAEFEELLDNVIYVSATPGKLEHQRSAKMVEQIIRPTGLLDPVLEVRPTEGQIEDLYGEIRKRIEKKERTLITTLTKKMAEDLTDYLSGLGLKVRYLHSEVETIERVEILRDLRLGTFDVLIGINLLREGLDLPEVSLITILDADKIGFLRSATSLIQTIGRAARNENGLVIMYADRMSDAMRAAIDETNRRRSIQEAYNAEHGITPTTIRKAIHDILERKKEEAKKDEAETIDMVKAGYNILIPAERKRLIRHLEGMMLEHAKNLEFEQAAMVRDEVAALKELGKKA